MRIKTGLLLLLLVSTGCANDIVGWSYDKEQTQLAMAQMDSVKVNLHTIWDVSRLMKRFVYEPQTFIWNYTPSIETVFLKKLTGNCQFSAVLGKWALECIGVPARLVSIYRDDSWHLIAVAETEDKIIVITNKKVLYFPLGDNYKTAILNNFNPPYTNWNEGVLKKSNNRRTTMGKTVPGKRDRTGPANRSAQRQNSGNVGKRQQKGIPCPKKK